MTRKVANRLKRLLIGLGIGAGAGSLALLTHTGWFSAPVTWEEATGWQAIPEEQRAPITAQPAPGLNLQWLGHSGFLLEWNGNRLLLDPNLSARCSLAVRRMPPPLAPVDLGNIDAVLISHSHLDHLDNATFDGLTRLGRLVLPTGASRYLPDDLPARTQVIEQPIGEPLEFAGLTITPTPARHNGSRRHPFGSAIEAVGYVIKKGETVLFYAGDTGMGEHLARIGETHKPDIAILPIGAFSPRLPLKYYHLSPRDAVQAAADLGHPLVIPCHFGTFVLSADRADTALPAFARAAADAQLAWRMPSMSPIDQVIITQNTESP